MSSKIFIALPDTSHHGPPQALKETGAVADSLAGIRNATVKCILNIIRDCMYKGDQVSPPVKYPEDSNFESLEAMQCVLGYLLLRTSRTTRV